MCCALNSNIQDVRCEAVCVLDCSVHAHCTRSSPKQLQSMRLAFIATFFVSTNACHLSSSLSPLFRRHVTVHCCRRRFVDGSSSGYFSWCPSFVIASIINHRALLLEIGQARMQCSKARARWSRFGVQLDWFCQNVSTVHCSLLSLQRVTTSCCFIVEYLQLGTHAQHTTDKRDPFPLPFSFPSSKLLATAPFLRSSFQLLSGSEGDHKWHKKQAETSSYHNVMIHDITKHSA